MQDSLPSFARRPLVGLAAFFLAGTAVGLHGAEFPKTIFLTGVICAFGALLWRAWGRNPERASAGVVRTGAINAALFLLAWAAASPGLRGISTHPPAGVSIGARGDATGVVIGDPDMLPEQQRGLITWRVPFRIEQWRVPGGGWVDVNVPVMGWWKIFEDRRAPGYGERFLLREVRWPAASGTGVALVPRSPAISAYNRQIHYLTDGHGSALRAWCYTARIRAADHLVDGIEAFPEEAGIQQALMLGYRQRLSDRVADLGATTGTLHIFAISGSHVAIIAGIFVFLLRVLVIPRWRWVLFLAPMLVVYTLATGAAASAVRACIMAILCFLGPAVGRRPDGASALAAAAMLIVAWDPTQLVDVGFVLSFVVVAGLVGLYPLFLEPLRAWIAPDPLMVVPETTLVRVGRAFAGALCSLLALSLAAWFASLPLTAYYFQRFTPITIIANLVVVPLAFLMVLSGCLSILIGSCSHLLAEIFNYASVALIRVFVMITEWLSHVPLANMTVERPALWWMAVYYLMLVLISARAWARCGPEVSGQPITGVEI